MRKSSPTLTAFYNKTQILTNVVQVDPKTVDIARTGQKIEDTVQVCATSSYLNFATNFSTLSWTSIEFDFKLRQETTVYRVKIENKKTKRKKSWELYAVSTDIPIYAATIEFFHNLDTGTYHLFINTTRPYFGFALWNTFSKLKLLNFINLILKKNIFLIIVDKKPVPTRSLLSQGHLNTQLLDRAFTLQSSPAAFSFTLKSGHTKQCFTLFKSSQSLVINAYLTFEGEVAGRRLFTLGKKESIAEHCLTDFIGLQNFGQFQLTFLLTGKDTQEADNNLITFRWEEYTVSEAAPLHQTRLSTQKSTPISRLSWLYNNELLFDYTFIATSNLPSPIFACDILGNCFPFEPLHTLGSGERAKYGLSREVKGYLRRSPQIRLTSASSGVEIEYLRLVGKLK